MALVGSQVGQALHRPVADFRIGIVKLADQYLVHSFRLDAAVAQQTQLP